MTTTPLTKTQQAIVKAKGFGDIEFGFSMESGQLIGTAIVETKDQRFAVIAVPLTDGDDRTYSGSGKSITLYSGGGKQGIPMLSPVGGQYGETSLANDTGKKVHPVVAQVTVYARIQPGSADVAPAEKHAATVAAKGGSKSTAKPIGELV